jgi:hypothetical protein
MNFKHSNDDIPGDENKEVGEGDRNSVELRPIVHILHIFCTVQYTDTYRNKPELNLSKLKTTYFEMRTESAVKGAGIV